MSSWYFVAKSHKSHLNQTSLFPILVLYVECVSGRLKTWEMNSLLVEVLPTDQHHQVINRDWT